MIFSVLILGSSSATPTLLRQPSAQLINIQERLMLVDCAEGTQVQLRKHKVNFQRISHIFISHLHGDHYFGLIGLMSTFNLMGRKKELHIYAHSDLQQIIRLQMDASGSVMQYPIRFHPLRFDKTDRIMDNELFSVQSLPLTHRIPTCGFIFREKERSRKIDKKFLLKHEIPIDQFDKIKAGADYISARGVRYKNEDITLDPPAPRSYAYCSDTSYKEDIVSDITDLDLLYHEATFTHDRKEDAKSKFHSTTKEAAEIAKLSNARKLIIGHFSARYQDLEPLLDECKEVFPNSELAIEGREFKIIPRH